MGAGDSVGVSAGSTTRFTRRYSNPPEEVWRALTDPAIVDLWFIPNPSVELRTGGRWTFVSSDHPLFRGTITGYENDRWIEYTYDNGSTMAFTLETDGDGSVLHFDQSVPESFVATEETAPPGYGWLEQPNGPGAPQPGLNASWHSNLDGLGVFLAGGDDAGIAAASRRERERPDEWRSLVDAYRKQMQS